MGTEDFDPRPIQGNTDLVNVVLGPWMKARGEQLRKIFNGGVRLIAGYVGNSTIVWASGMTCEQTG